MLTFEELMTCFQVCVIIEDENICQTLSLFTEKLSEASRASVKRCKERCLEEALQLLRLISEDQLLSLKEDKLLILVRLLLSLQLQMANISTACRKVDQMLQQLAKTKHSVVLGETQHCLQNIIQAEQLLSLEDLQRACMFLEDSAIGRDVWRESLVSLLSIVSELYPVVLQKESLRDGPLCYITVKICLQTFQLLSAEVAPLVWDEDHVSPSVQMILQALMDIIFGKCCNRDTRLLAGTAVAMLIKTAPESRAGEAAAWNLLQVSHSEPWRLTVGALQVQCVPVGRDGMDRLVVCRGLLTSSRPHILLSSHEKDIKTCFLLKGLFPLVYALCEEKLDCHYFAFEALTLWLRKVKECLAEIWRMTRVPLLTDGSSLQQELIHLIWTNAESPVEGVAEFVQAAFGLLLDLYEMDCEHFSHTKKTLYVTLLQRIIQLPWEAKAKYHRLCTLLPFLGTDMVLDQYAEIPSHILKCLSTNHLSPCGSELYRCLILQQSRELSVYSHTETELVNQWASRWRPVVLEALMSDVALLQNNSASLLLPSTFQVFPSAVDPLLSSLDPYLPGHLHAWACILNSYRAMTGRSPWALMESSTFQTLQLALGSADDKVRLAALNLLCCSPKTKDTPTIEEMSILRTFIPQNLNCESSPFRQHFQTAIKKFLVRIRDGCLAQVRGQKTKKKEDTKNCERTKEILQEGLGFVDWLAQLPYSYLAPGHSYQRKKTALLLLLAVLETCTDSWSPDKKKGQPPASMGSLIQCARQRGLWDFFCRTKQLILIGCLEDSTNEIRELSAELLLRFFPPRFAGDIAVTLLTRTKQLLCSPRVQEAQMGALMMKVLLYKSQDHPENCRGSRDVSSSSGSPPEVSCMVRFLVAELEEHYLTAKADMMLAARTKPIHGVLSALQRCLVDGPSSLYDTLGHNLTMKVLDLMEETSLLLLGVLYGDMDACASETDAPPSFCEMGNAISSLIAQASGGGQADREEIILLSEEHSLVLTCCWVSLKEIGIFLGSLVEKILTESKPNQCPLTKDDLRRAAKVFKNILLRCRHWGAVEGCCVGFTKFCSSLLSSRDPDLREIPALMLKQGLQVVQSPCSTSVTRRAGGLPMLILCVLSAEEPNKSRPLLAHSMQTLLETAKTPVPEDWDQTVDLPQVCAVHTLQALVRGSGLGAAVLQFAPSVAVLSLSLMSSLCWAMRNAALQLYSSLCSRMLGQRPSSEEGGPAQHGMSPLAFFIHYPTLESFLVGELGGAAKDLQGPFNQARLHLQPSLYPVLTLLAQLQPGVHDSAESLSDFLPPLLQLSASPIHSVRVMASKALVAMTPPSEYMGILHKLTTELPSPREPCCHNRLHGQLLQIRALSDRVLSLHSAHSADLQEVLGRVEASLWLVTEAQRCPLVRAAYLSVVESLRESLCETFLSKISETFMNNLQKPQQQLQVGSSSFHQKATHFLCSDLKWASQIWDTFPSLSLDLRLTLVTWVLDGRGLQHTSLNEAIQRVLQSNLKGALLGQNVEYCRTYLSALVALMSEDASASLHRLPQSAPLEEPVLPECVELLLGDLEEQRGGPEFLSQALCAASLLLFQLSDSSVKASLLQRWCHVLEIQRSPHVPEVLRLACAKALCAASERECNIPPLIMVRLMNTGLYLLQDQSQHVRLKAACFTSTLHHKRRAIPQRSVYVRQVNQALPLLLNLLLEDFWDVPGTLEVLLCHLAQSELRLVLKEASETVCSSLYEQDEANVYAEPSVMSAHVLPYLLQMAEKYSKSSALAQRQRSWAEDNAAHVLDGLKVCKELQPAESLTPAWLAHLRDPCFHSTLCGLITRGAFLLQLLKTSDHVHHLCDPPFLHRSLQDVCSLLSQSGVHFPPTLTAAVYGEQPLRHAAARTPSTDG